MKKERQFEKILKEIINTPCVVKYEDVLLRSIYKDIKRNYQECRITEKEEIKYLYALPSRPETVYGILRIPEVDNIPAKIPILTSRPEIVFSIHTDRHGFYVVDEDAVVFDKDEFSRSHTISPYSIREICNRYTNEKVYAYNPLTGEILARGKLLGTCSPKYITYIDDNRIKLTLAYYVQWFEKKDKLREDTPVAFEPFLIISPTGYIYGQIDNAISISVILALLKDKKYASLFREKISLIFTTREEIGESWKCLKHFYEEILKTQDVPLIVLDTRPYRKEEKDKIEEGEVIIRSRDALSEYDQNFVSDIVRILRNNNIPYEIYDKKEGKTELGRLLQNGVNVRGITLQIPTIYQHKLHEMTTQRAVENYMNAIISIINS